MLHLFPGFLATYEHFLKRFLPLKRVTLNFNEPSLQVEHVPQVDGQCDETPLRLHLLGEFDTQPQSLALSLPLILTLNLSCESIHEFPVGDGGVGVGAVGVGAVGVPVPGQSAWPIDDQH